MLLWASSFIALKFSFASFDPMVVIFGRMAVATLCFALIAVVRGDLFAFERFRRRDLRLLLTMALAEPGFYFLFEACAVANTSASQAGIITAILPVLVLIAAALLLGERMPAVVWFGALLAFAGVVVLTLAGSADEKAPNPVLGNTLEFGAMLCATVYTITMKQLVKRYTPLFLTALQAAVGTLFFLPLLFLPTTTLPQSFPLPATLAVIYLGAVITIGAYGLYNYSLKHIPASRAAAWVNLIPIFAVLMGWLLLGERLNIVQIAAGAVIFTGVLLTRRG